LSGTPNTKDFLANITTKAPGDFSVWFAWGNGYPTLKYIGAGVMGHEIIETITDPCACYGGWVLKAPYCWGCISDGDTSDNIEFCDYCNRPDSQNKTGGSGLLDAEGSGGISVYTNGAYGNCYWDEAGGGCRANGSIDANRIRKPLGVARYLGKGFLANAKLIWIFWGEEWKSQTNPSRTDILRNYALLDNTPYYQPLLQYNINKPGCNIR
jgi:hypothetical protein